MCAAYYTHLYANPELTTWSFPRYLPRKSNFFGNNLNRPCDLTKDYLTLDANALLTDKYFCYLYGLYKGKT